MTRKLEQEVKALLETYSIIDTTEEDLQETIRYLEEDVHQLEEAKNNVTNISIDTFKAAADALTAGRDALKAMREARAKLQGNNRTEGSLAIMRAIGLVGSCIHFISQFVDAGKDLHDQSTKADAARERKNMQRRARTKARKEAAAKTSAGSEVITFNTPRKRKTPVAPPPPGTEGPANGNKK